MFLVFGTKKSGIGYEEIYMPCPCCESHTEAEVLVTGTYFHLYGIPFWPMDKEASSVCCKCGLKRYDLPIEDKFIPDAKEFLRKFSHPWYTYVGPAILSVIIAFIIVSCFR